MSSIVGKGSNRHVDGLEKVITEVLKLLIGYGTWEESKWTSSFLRLFHLLSNRLLQF